MQCPNSTWVWLVYGLQYTTRAGWWIGLPHSQRRRFELLLMGTNQDGQPWLMSFLSAAAAVWITSWWPSEHPKQTSTLKTRTLLPTDTIMLNCSSEIFFTRSRRAPRAVNLLTSFRNPNLQVYAWATLTWNSLNPICRNCMWFCHYLPPVWWYRALYSTYCSISLLIWHPLYCALPFLDILGLVWTQLEGVHHFLDNTVSRSFLLDR